VDVTVGLASPGQGASTSTGPNTSASVSSSAEAAGATRPPGDGSVGRFAGSSGLVVGLGVLLVLFVW